MANDSATLSLLGDQVPFAAYVKAMDHFRGLIDALSTELAARASIEWIVEDLARSSATTTIRGEAIGLDATASVERVVSAYDSLAATFERGDLAGYAPKIVREITGLTDILNGKVEAIVFQSAVRETIIRKRDRAGEGQWQPTPAVEAYGAIEGRVQTLTSRGGLRFTLYDALHDRAVSCYVTEGRDSLLRDIWGRRVLVEGWISRDAQSGRPLAVRQITSITELPERGPGSYRDARGAVPLKPGGLLPEVAIRRLRDA
jgi:hypothetical protein